jgi:hypothetical protein
MAGVVALVTGCTSSTPGRASGPAAVPGTANISTVAGTGVVCTRDLLPCGDGGPASQAPLGTPDAATGTPDGGYLIAERDIEKIRRVSPQGVIDTVTGTGAPCPDPTDACGHGGPATRAQIHHPHFVISSPDGGFLIADRLDNRIRMVSADGVITTVAGNGLPCRPHPDSCGDGGPALQAALSSPHSASFIPAGIIVADRDDDRIRLLTGTGLKHL